MGDIFEDWIKEHLSAFFGGVYDYGYQADYVIKSISKDYKDCDIYITGHSLGGYLAQRASYYLNFVLDEDNYNESLIGTVTFNSEPILASYHLNDELKGTLSSYNEIEKYGYRGEKNQRFIHNYHIKGDMMEKYLMSWLGCKLAGGSKALFEKPSPMSSVEAHKLDNFYPYVSSISY